MPQRPSFRDIVCTAIDFLALGETCPAFAELEGYRSHAPTLRKQIQDYNGAVDALGTDYVVPRERLAFEDLHAETIVVTLSRCLETVRDAVNSGILEGRGVFSDPSMHPGIFIEGLHQLIRKEYTGIGRAFSTGNKMEKYQIPGTATQVTPASSARRPPAPR